MSYATIAISFAVSFLIGHLSLSAFWPPRQRSTLFSSIQLFYSFAIGTGISSLLFFFWLMLRPAGSGVRSFILVETAAMALAALIYISKPAKRIPDVSAMPPTDKASSSALLSIFSIGLVVSVFYFITITIVQRHGGWDAWAVWNMRARFLFRGPDQWREALILINPRLHPDYPLFLPSLIAKVWAYIGSDCKIVPMAAGFLFTFGTVGLIVSCLWQLRSKEHGLIGGILLLSCPGFISLGASQYADIPLAFFFISCIILFYLYDSDDEKKDKRFLYMAGAIAGFSAWVKNEGIVFIAVILFSRFLCVSVSRGIKIALKEIVMVSAGVLPLAVIIAYFKYWLVPPNADIALPQNMHALFDRISHAPRYYIIVKAFLKQIMSPDYIIIGGIPFLILYLFAVGLKPEKKYIESILTSIITLISMLTAYFIVFLITTHPVEWQIAASLSRLFAQIWPIALFTFLMVSGPAENFCLK